MVALPGIQTEAGAETRVLLAECRSPAYGSYNLGNATLCMLNIDLVLRNRLMTPSKFNAKGAKSLIGIIKAKGQFAGFAAYPDYDQEIKDRIQDMLDIANASKDSRSIDYAAHIQAAINAALPPAIPDASPGKLTAWRTAGSGSPGSGFLKYVTLLGIDFYYVP